MLGSEVLVLYPLELIQFKELGDYPHIDANIGKIIIPGRSAGRNFELFQKAASAGGGGPVTASPAAKAEEATPPRALTPSLEDKEVTPPRTSALTATHVLHVFGLTSSEYYYGVSRYYMRNAWENLGWEG